MKRRVRYVFTRLLSYGFVIDSDTDVGDIVMIVAWSWRSFVYARIGYSCKNKVDVGDESEEKTHL